MDERLTTSLTPVITRKYMHYLSTCVRYEAKAVNQLLMISEKMLCEKKQSLGLKMY